MTVASRWHRASSVPKTWFFFLLGAFRTIDKDRGFVLCFVGSHDKSHVDELAIRLACAEIKTGETIALMNGKRMYDMDESELEAFIAKQEHTVAKLNHERPGSPQYNHEAELLKDAKQLFEEKQTKKKFLRMRLSPK